MEQMRAGCKREEVALYEREARLQAILDTAVEGIITIDERGYIESFNKAAEQIFGYKASELLGQNVSILIGVTLDVASDAGRGATATCKMRCRHA